MNSLICLNLPREYTCLVLVGKRILDPIYVSNEQLARLGASESLQRKYGDKNEKEFSEWLQ